MTVHRHMFSIPAPHVVPAVQMLDYLNRVMSIPTPDGAEAPMVSVTNAGILVRYYSGEPDKVPAPSLAH